MNPIRTSLTALSMVGLLAACQEEHHAEAPAPRPVLTVVVAPQTARTVGFAGTVEPRYKSDLGFRVLGRIISRDVNVATSSGRGSAWPRSTRSPTSWRCGRRRPTWPARPPASRMPPRPRPASARCSSRTSPPRRSMTLPSRPASPRRPASRAPGRTSTRPRSNSATPSFAPTFDGVVTATEAELGQVVQPGQTVVSVARPDIREAVVDLPESIGRDLRPGARFDIALQVDPSVRAAGSVREIAPQADPATRTLRVRITLDNPPESFRLGTTITATVTTQAAPGIELPASALLERDGRTMVWVVDPATRTVSTRDVTIAARDGSAVRVLDGLTSGTRVVTAGVHSLTPNQTVKIADEASQ